MRSWNAWFNTQSRTLRHEELRIKPRGLFTDRGVSIGASGHRSVELR